MHILSLRSVDSFLSMEATDPGMRLNCPAGNIQIIMIMKPAIGQSVFQSKQTAYGDRKPRVNIRCVDGGTVIERMLGKLMQLRRAKKIKLTIP